MDFKLIDVQQIADMTGRSVASVWLDVKQDGFPNKITIGRAARWVEKDVVAFYMAKADCSDSATRNETVAA